MECAPTARSVNWTNAVFAGATPIAAVAGTWLYARGHGIAAGDLVAFGAMMALGAIGIIPGYHRYFTHRTYECRRPLQVFYLVAAASGFHQSALVWASAHRDHHRSVDTDRDPYNIHNSFLWAHIGWTVPGTTTPHIAERPDLPPDPLL